MFFRDEYFSGFDILKNFNQNFSISKFSICSSLLLRSSYVSTWHFSIWVSHSGTLSSYSLDLLLGICQQILWWQCCLKMEHVLQKKYNFPFYDSCTKKWDNIPVSIDIVGHIKYVMPHILFGSPKKIWHFIINYQRDTYCLFFCLARDPSAQREGASILNRTIKCSSSAASPL